MEFFLGVRLSVTARQLNTFSPESIGVFMYFKRLQVLRFQAEKNSSLRNRINLKPAT
jgi:hypothetical protein